MMGRKSTDKVEPAPEEAILKYKSMGKDEDGPSRTQFKPDFSKTHTKESLWNLRLAEIFENDYVHLGQPFTQVKDVSKYFLAYLWSLQATNRKMTTTTTDRSRNAHKEGLRCNRIKQRKKA